MAKCPFTFYYLNTFEVKMRKETFEEICTYFVPALYILLAYTHKLIINILAPLIMYIYTPDPFNRHIRQPPENSVVFRVYFTMFISRIRRWDSPGKFTFRGNFEMGGFFSNVQIINRFHGCASLPTVRNVLAKKTRLYAYTGSHFEVFQSFDKNDI